MSTNFKLFVLFFLFSTSIFSQEFSGIAYYKSKENIKGTFRVSGVSEQKQKEIEEKMSKDFEKNAVLYFDKSTSVFSNIKELQVSNSKNNGVNVLTTSDDEGKIFKNIKEKTLSREEDLFDKPFIIEDKLELLDWKISDETKKIGDYNCQKAVAIIPVSQKDLDDYKKELEDIKAYNITMEVKAPKPKVHTVWFTPFIPVNNGPALYWGLPGLILEATDGRISYFCTKIVLNPIKKVIITKPTKGKKVTQKQFDKISDEKIESMKGKDGIIHLNIGG